MSATPPRLSSRNVAAAIAGNALEFYDFVTYAFFAVQIGRVFFPAYSEYGSLMLSLGTFGAGFAMRPIGGILIGRYADRVGRKPAMIFSLALMGAAVLAVAVIPSYAAIGVAAPVLVVIARMAQGFALGGQVGSTTAFLMEAAPLSERGVYTAWQGGSQYCASLAGGIVGILLSSFLDADQLQTYGWRIAFALGALTLPFGLFLIRNVPETLNRSADISVDAAAGGDWALCVVHRRVILLGLVTLASATIFTYLTNYMTTFAETVLHLGNAVAFGATLVVGVSGLAGVMFGGWLSDRVGRWPVMVWPRVVYLFFVWPLYAWIVEMHGAAALYAATAVLVFLGTMSFGPFYAALTESLPTRIRGSAVGTTYAISIAIFGGSAQLIVTWLIHVSGNPLAPAWYLIASGICGVISTAMMAETAPVRVGLAAHPAPAAAE
ncbi:MAG TPA: MFS transporter [Rhizomicrobium sp.]|nr:MFS transporter [Rhizomicrobium sp.]